MTNDNGELKGCGICRTVELAENISYCEKCKTVYINHYPYRKVADTPDPKLEQWQSRPDSKDDGLIAELYGFATHCMHTGQEQVADLIYRAIAALPQAGSGDIDQWEAQENIKKIDNLNAINESLVDRIKQLESQQSEPAKPKAEDGDILQKDYKDIDRDLTGRTAPNKSDYNMGGGK